MNNENIFQTETNSSQDEEVLSIKYDDLIILFNFSNDEGTIWVHFDKAWDVDRCVKVLNELVVLRKLNMVG